MLFGMCMAIEDEENMRIASDYGFDYVEGNFQMLSRGTEEKHRAVSENIKKYGIDCLAANGFLPADLKCCGEDRNPAALYDYVKKGLDFGAELGLKKVVFGSGGARQIPNGCCFTDACRETADFLEKIVSPLFTEYGVQLVIEPLRREECNFINTVKEGAGLSVLSNSDNIFCLADIFHMYCENDSFENITDLKGLVKHSHISYPKERFGMNRSYPLSGDEFDYYEFIRALKAAGCNTCSIEAGTKDRAADACLAMKVLRKLDTMEV